ncbi:MAG: hypothetical protein V1904_05570 [Bacteroidota bacterium]
MKKTTALLIVFFTSVFIVTAQQNQLIEERTSASENLEVFKGTIGDSSLGVMKELVRKQDDLIEADRAIIDGYLYSLKNNADSLKRMNTNLIIDKEMLDKELMINKDLLFYGMIGGGVIFILFILFLILFFIASGKKKKFKKLVDDVEKMKQANQKEIELAKKDVETMKTVARKEIMQAKEELNKDARNMQAKIDSLSAEKSSLEKKAGDKAFEFSQMQLRLNTIKDDYEKKLAEANAGNANFTREKLLLEKQIFDKGLEIDNIIKERDDAKQEHSDLKVLYDKETTERKAFEEKLTEIENEMRNIVPANTGEIDTLKNENEKLRNDINNLSEYRNLYEKELFDRKQLEDRLAEKENELRNMTTVNTNEVDDLKRNNEGLLEDIEELNKRIDREVQGRNMIEDELRKFIDELKNLR